MLIYLEKKHKKKNAKKTIKHLLTIHSFPATYTDKECVFLQCRAGKRRSIGEFYYIIKTMFPYVSQKNVFKQIYAYIITGEVDRCIICCNDVNKLVIHTRFFSGNLEFGVFHDYGNYIKNKRRLVDKFNIFYFLTKVGFSKEEVRKIFYNKE